MFKFLKEKLKGAISKLTKKAEDNSVEEEKVEEKEEEIKELEKEKKELKKKEKKVEKEIKKVKEKPAKKKVEKKTEEKPKKEEKKKESVKKEKKVVEEKVIEKVEEKEPEPVIEEEKEEIFEKEVEEKPIIKKEKEPEIEEVIEKVEEEPEQKIKELEKEKEDIQKEEKEIEVLEETAKKEKKGFFSKIKEKITKTKLNVENFEKLFWELEVVLLENNMAVEVIEKIKEDLKKTLVDNPIPRGKVDEVITNSLKNSIKEVLSVESIDIEKQIKDKEGPYVICFIGVNGSGKTTSIAKVANYLKEKGISCVLAAADTFRAAAIDQLQIHADKLDIKLIKHDYGSDAAAVAFDAIKHAEAKKVDCVLIDTAGRMHSNSNLMEEMKKIVRVANPDLKVFVGESIVGNDCIEQANEFNNSVGIDGIVLSKVDVDEKGGASISVSYVTKKPIIFIGTGQEYGDLEKFQPELVLENLGL